MEVGGWQAWIAEGDEPVTNPTVAGLAAQLLGFRIDDAEDAAGGLCSKSSPAANASRIDCSSFRSSGVTVGSHSGSRVRLDT